MKKIFVLLLMAAFAASCSNDDSSSGGTSMPTPMTATVDTYSFSLQPEQGGNLSDPSGGMYGSDYHLLEGYKLLTITTAKTTLKEYDYYIRLAIPKIDVSVGNHNFAGAQLPNGYYADLDIEALENDNGENEATISGSINVTSYDMATQRVRGTFNFTTNNGVTATETHDVSGTFNYILAD